MNENKTVRPDDIPALIHEASERIDRALGEYYTCPDGSPAELYEAMRYSLLAGGKRIRPFLTLAFCRAHVGDEEAAVPFACAIESLHSDSLIHDDMPCLDGDTVRRGAPTNHVRYGEGTAMLAGDGMQAKAFSIAAENTHVGADAALDALRALAHAAGPDGMVGGQMLDLIGESRRLSRAELLHMNTLKTCRFISVACELGCIAAGADKAARRRAVEYGEAIGLCYQLTDDLLDADTEKAEKTTFLSYYTADEARDYAARLTAKAKEMIAQDDREGTLSALADMLLSRKV